MAIKICKNCKKETFHHSKGYCITCYKKLIWKPIKVKCAICGEMKPHHAKGMCKNCSNKKLYYNNIKKYNYLKWHNLDLDTYTELTKKCHICGFDKIVDLHHKDGNHDNSSKDNLVALCPNHHKMIHMDKYKEDIVNQLKQNDQ